MREDLLERIEERLSKIELHIGLSKRKPVYFATSPDGKWQWTLYLPECEKEEYFAERTKLYDEKGRSLYAVCEEINNDSN